MKNSEKLKILVWYVSSSVFLTTGLFCVDYVKSYFAMLAALCVVEGIKILVICVNKV